MRTLRQPSPPGPLSPPRTPEFAFRHLTSAVMGGSPNVILFGIATQNPTARHSGYAVQIYHLDHRPLLSQWLPEPLNLSIASAGVRYSVVVVALSVITSLKAVPSLAITRIPPLH